MRCMVLMLMAAGLIGCSEAERSATTPAPNVTYVSAAGTEADAASAAAHYCSYYHSEPATATDHADAYPRYECKGRARGGESFFVEQMGL